MRNYIIVSLQCRKQAVLLTLGLSYFGGGGSGNSKMRQNFKNGLLLLF